MLHLEHLTKPALRTAFTMLGQRSRCRLGAACALESWSSFFDFLVAEDLVEGNPMAAVGKPRRHKAPTPRSAAAGCTPSPRWRPWRPPSLASSVTFRRADAPDE